MEVDDDGIAGDIVGRHLITQILGRELAAGVADHHRAGDFRILHLHGDGVAFKNIQIRKAVVDGGQTVGRGVLHASVAHHQDFTELPIGVKEINPVTLHHTRSGQGDFGSARQNQMLLAVSHGRIGAGPCLALVDAHRIDHHHPILTPVEPHQARHTCQRTSFLFTAGQDGIDIDLSGIVGGGKIRMVPGDEIFGSRFHDADVAEGFTVTGFPVLVNGVALDRIIRCHQQGVPDKSDIAPVVPGFPPAAGPDGAFLLQTHIAEKISRAEIAIVIGLVAGEHPPKPSQADISKKLIVFEFTVIESRIGFGFHRVPVDMHIAVHAGYFLTVDNAVDIAIGQSSGPRPG